MSSHVVSPINKTAGIAPRHAVGCSDCACVCGYNVFLGVFGLLRQGVLCIPYIGKKDNMWLSVVFLLQDRPPAIAEASGLVLSVVLHQYVAWLRLLPCGLSGSLYDQGCY